MILRAFAVILAMATSITLNSTSATADTVYQPPSGTFNGNVIYISRACHDGNDGVPGGPCITNHGCNGKAGKLYKENGNSKRTARAVTYAGKKHGTGLLIHRGYRVVIGNGTVQQNIRHSNARKRVKLHIPIHSNASPTGGRCVPRKKKTHGTQPHWRSKKDKRCGRMFKQELGNYSPGTRDKLIYTTALSEINQINVATCYLELEYHDTNRGVNWMRTRREWAWLFGVAVDRRLGYPRA